MRRKVQRLLLGLPLALSLLGIAPPDAAESEASAPPATHRSVPHGERYEPLRAGHPVRIIAYALHPVGVILDYLIFRPVHWLGSHEPLRTLFGQER
jgi:hypothetical protein